MSVQDNATKLGKENQNLILETAGRIWIKVQDRFYELDFKNNGKSEKEVQIINNYNEPQENNIDLSKFVSKNYLKSALTEYVTKRGWKDLIETSDLLQNSGLEGFTEAISPITINTMQLVVGSNQLQYDFINNYDDGEVISGGFIVNEDGEAPLTSTSIKLTGGWIKHYTIDGPNTVRAEDDAVGNSEELLSKYCRWHINDATYPLSPELAYYVYIKVPRLELVEDFPKKSEDSYILPNNVISTEDVALKYKTNKRVNYSGNGHNNDEGEYVISTQAIGFDSDSDFYYLLFAIVNSTSEDSSRSYTTMNGFTEITPGRITAYRFMSPDGIQYINFLDKSMHLGDGTSYIDYNNGIFKVKGLLLTEGSIYVKDGNNGKVVAGLIGGPGINIFAGANGESNINSANFRVTNDGGVYVGGAIRAVGSTFEDEDNNTYAIQSDNGLYIFSGKTLISGESTAIQTPDIKLQSFVEAGTNGGIEISTEDGNGASGTYSSLRIYKNGVYITTHPSGGTGAQMIIEPEDITIQRGLGNAESVVTSDDVSHIVIVNSGGQPGELENTLYFIEGSSNES